jgi:hypothetical protein
LFDFLSRWVHEAWPGSRAPANRTPRTTKQRYFGRLSLPRCAHAKTVPESFVRLSSRWLRKSGLLSWQRRGRRRRQARGKSQRAPSKPSLRQIRVRPTPQQPASPCPAPRSPLSHAIRRLDRTGAAEMAAVAGANSMETDDSHTAHTLAQTAIARCR